jgi:CheY-like chemotaxis protein
MAKKRVLVVDDEVSFTRLLKLSLEKTGTYEVKVVNEGSLAFACAREFKPDLILLDLVIPDMDGREVASRIEADEEMKKIPIVFLTGFPLSEVNTGKPFLSKPLSVQEIIACIEKHIA